MGETGAFFEKTDEAFAVFRLIVEMAVDFAGGLPPSAQRARRDGDDAVALLHNFDDAENVFRLLFKNIFIVGCDLVADLIIVFIDLVHHARQNGKYPAAQHGDDDAVELLDRFGGAVKLVHQFFAFFAFVVVAQAHVFRNQRLQVENQAVFFASGRQMQLDADFGQLLVAVDQMAGLGAGEYAVINQGLDIGIQTLRFGQPQHGVHIAQAAGAGFDIGLQNRAGALLFVVPLLHFQKFALNEKGGIALQGELLQQLVGQLVIAADEACFDKSGVGGQIVERALAEFGQRTGFDGGCQLDVPQGLYEGADLFLFGFG